MVWGDEEEEKVEDAGKERQKAESVGRCTEEKKVPYESAVGRERVKVGKKAFLLALSRLEKFTTAEPLSADGDGRYWICVGIFVTSNPGLLIRGWLLARRRTPFHWIGWIGTHRYRFLSPSCRLEPFHSLGVGDGRRKRTRHWGRVPCCC